MRCLACTGFTRREPAAVTCVLCGRYVVVVDASPAARLLQVIIDRERRPRSVECVPPFNEVTFLGPRRRFGAVQPGPRLPVAVR
jgi:hypothetical protein